MMRPAEILDAQGDLVERLNGEEEFREALSYFVGRHYGTISGADEKSKRRMAKERLASGMPAVTALAQHSQMAYSYRVTHDMCLMVEQGAAALDDTDRFDASLAPTPSGFLRFDRPMPFHDVRGNTMLMHWLIWGPGRVSNEISGKIEWDPGYEVADHGMPGLSVWFFNDPWTEPDETYELFLDTLESQRERERFIRLQGRWSVVGTDVFPTGQRMGPQVLQPPEHQRSDVLAEGYEPQPGTNPMRYVHALFLLLNQTITEVADEEPERPARRRAVRRALPPKVSVIRLRRTKDSVQREGESLVEWSHRWISRAHWRWQPYGPRGADHEHALGPAMADEHGRTSVRFCEHTGCEHRVERIMVKGSIKGPADKPLVVSDKVYQLER